MDSHWRRYSRWTKDGCAFVRLFYPYLVYIFAFLKTSLESSHVSLHFSESRSYDDFGLEFRLIST
jgi:hypothetical protein